LRRFDLSFARIFAPRALVVLALFSVAGCLQTVPDVTNKDHPSAFDAIKSADLQPKNPRGFGGGGGDSGARAQAGVSFFGSPVEPAALGSAEPDAAGGFTLNFENTPVASVAQAVLGDILHVGYVVDPRAQGTITLSSGRPVAKKDILFVLENALRANNLSLVRDPVGYRVAPSADLTIGGVDRANNRNEVEPGYGMTVIPLEYISGATLTRLMEGFAAKPGTIRADPSGRIILVLGTGAERQAAVDTVRDFDVDFMRGQSVGIYPVRNSAPAPVVAELEKIMDSGEGGRGHDVVKFQAIDRQNAIMVVASRADLLRTAQNWIARLDGGAQSATGFKVYKVRYGDAKQITALLGKMFDIGGAGGDDSASGQVAPGSGTKSLSASDRLTGGGGSSTSGGISNGAIGGGGDTQIGQGRPAGDSAGGAGAAGGLGSAYGALADKFASQSGTGPFQGVRITADAPNNSILIYASAENYRVIEKALIQLDRPKLQVAVDVTIAEVTLTDDLNYGVQFFLTNRFGSFINTSSTTTPIQPNLPGANLVFGSSVTPQAVINALHQYTDVKILSNPSLVVVDNQIATLEVGDQVPVSTGSANVLSANNAVVNTIDYKNTGIILRVQPRVNSNGSVLLDIEQEISSVPDTGTSAANLTPTISERKVKSELNVNDGQTVLLAGLISDTQSISHSGVPILETIPLIGNALTSKDKKNSRTELILFIRPQIIRDGADAASVAEQLRSKMRGAPLGPLGLENPLLAPPPKRILQ
jgi:general secretion pathway protein D